ncbi:MAG: DNA/RNA-binding winged helix domain-containing protein, partial [Nannocystaceae bacterium]
GSDGTLAPSAQGVVRLRLSTPIPTWAGQRLILRAFVNPRGGDLKLADAGCTIGGGTVLDPNPGSGRGQRTRWQQLTTLLRSDDPAVRLAGIVDDAGVRGIDLADLEARSGVPLDPGAPLPGVPEQAIVALSQNRVVAAKALGPLIRRALVRVDQFHVANPSQPGMPRAVLEQQLTGRACPDVVAAALVHALDAGELRAGEDASLVSLPGQGLHTGDANPAWIQAILDIFVARGTSPPTTRDLTTATGNSERQVFEAISVLQRQGALARISREMSMAMQAHGQLIELVRQHLAAEGNMD